MVVWFRVWRITKGGNVLKTGSSDGYLYLSELVPVLMPHSRGRCGARANSVFDALKEIASSYAWVPGPFNLTQL